MKRVVARELMDGDVDSIAELEGNLSDIEWANRLLGGIAPVLREVRRSGGRTILDVCCGSGDVVRAVVRDAGRRRVAMTATGLDRSKQMLDIARRRTPREIRLDFTCGDALALPFADAAFDIVTCNLALHHFEPDAARRVLREVRRVARHLPLVCDLRRSAPAYAAALIWSRLVSRNRLTRHDAPLSVRRAYTARELRALAVGAGWRAPRVRHEAFFRMTLVDVPVRS